MGGHVILAALFVKLCWIGAGASVALSLFTFLRNSYQGALDH